MYLQNIVTTPKRNSVALVIIPQLLLPWGSGNRSFLCDTFSWLYISYKGVVCCFVHTFLIIYFLFHTWYSRYLCFVVLCCVCVCESYSIKCIEWYYLFIHYLKDIWIIPTFWLLWIVQLWASMHSVTWTHVLNSLGYECRTGTAEWDGNSLTSLNGLTFRETTKLPSKVAAPFYIPSSPAWGFQVLCIIVNTCISFHLYLIFEQLHEIDTILVIRDLIRRLLLKEMKKCAQMSQSCLGGLGPRFKIWIQLVSVTSAFRAVSQMLLHGW